MAPASVEQRSSSGAGSRSASSLRRLSLSTYPPPRMRSCSLLRSSPARRRLPSGRWPEPGRALSAAGEVDTADLDVPAVEPLAADAVDPLCALATGEGAAVGALDDESPPALVRQANWLRRCAARSCRSGRHRQRRSAQLGSTTPPSTRCRQGTPPMRTMPAERSLEPRSRRALRTHQWTSGRRRALRTHQRAPGRDPGALRSSPSGPRTPRSSQVQERSRTRSPAWRSSPRGPQTAGALAWPLVPLAADDEAESDAVLVWVVGDADTPPDQPAPTLVDVCALVVRATGTVRLRLTFTAW